MFKKRNRNFRARRAASDSDDDANGADSETPNDGSPAPSSTSGVISGTSSPVSIEVKKRRKKDTKEKKTVLSFGDDLDQDDGEVFKVKKSSHSKRVAKQLKKETRKEKEQRLAEAAEAERRQKEEEERKIKLAQDRLNGSRHTIEDEDSGPSISDFSDEDEETAKKSSMQSVLQSGQIPDAHMIHLARKQRQMKREQGDFIPLDDTTRATEDKSRLIREDDNDHDSDDDGNRRFLPATREEELRDIQTQILAAHEDEESDHEDSWVQQQIRKGVNIPQVAPTATNMEPTEAYKQFVYNQSSNIFNPKAPGADQSFERPSIANKPNKSTLMDLPQLTVSAVMKQMKDRLDEVTNINRAHRLEKTDIESRLETCEEAIEKCSDSVPELEKTSVFFQEMRGYVRDLVDCLNAKSAEIDYLDRLLMVHFKTVSEKLIKRRQQDMKDLSEEYTPARVDSGPKPMDPEKQRRNAEREARKARRRRARESKGVYRHDDGMSTDDEMNNSETLKFASERSRLKEDCGTIWNDVMEDFSEVDLVKSRFESWKLEQSESYDEAYISLCLPKLFSPYVKLALIDWNPLEENCPNFEESAWFATLIFYGYQEGDRLSADMPDVNLLPSLVEKVLLPKTTALVETVWDPLSSQQTTRLVNLLHRLMADYPTFSARSKNTGLIFEAICKRIKRSIDEDVYIPLYPKATLEKKSSGEFVFFTRQFWSCVKLLRNVLAWQGLLSESKLKELGMDCLLNRYLILGLMNTPDLTDALHRAQMVTATLPKSWFTGLKGEKTLPQLENLCRFLTNTAVQLGSQSKITTEVNDGLKMISKMLLNIHALDHAQTVASKYSIRL